MANKPKGMESYLALVKKASTNSVNAALGQNNENSIKGIGYALALYAKWNDKTINIEDSFSNLIACDTLNEIRNNFNAIKEIVNNSFLLNFIIGNSYASDIVGLLKNPYMTSNTAPYGTCSASGVYDSKYYQAYKAFDSTPNNTSGSPYWWMGSGKTSAGQWVMYDFGFEVRPISITFSGGINTYAINYIIQGSVDGSDFIKLAEISTNGQSFGNVFDFELTEESAAYRYYRVYVSSCKWYPPVNELRITGLKV